MSVVEVDEKILTAAKARLVEMKDEWNVLKLSGYVSKGECWRLDGSVIPGAHQVCHSWVGKAFNDEAKTDGDYHGSWSTGAKYNAGAKTFLTLNVLNKAKTSASHESLDALVLWLARESPFSKFILNRDDTESLTNSGVVILCGPDGASHTEAMWICKVMRYHVEGKQALDTWKTLYEAGVSPFLAVLVATHIGALSGATFSYSAVTSHVSVFGYAFDRADVTGLVKGEFNPKATETAQLFETPKCTRVPNLTNKLKEFCKPFQKSDGWGGTVNGQGCDGSELVRRVLAWQAEIQGQMAPPPMPTAETVYLDVDL